MAVIDDTSGRAQTTKRSEPRAPAADAERDYVELRESVYRSLAIEFSGRLDYEELYQDAWVELLEWEAKGNRTINRRAVLRKIVWQRAVDAKRRKTATPLEPASRVFLERVDPQATPDEAATSNLDRATLWGAIDTLDEREQAVIKLRFDCDYSSQQIADYLGVPRHRLEKIVKRAYTRLAEQLNAADGASAWDARRHSVLLACELGVASRRRRRWAQALVDRDPIARGQLRELRSALRDVAAVLPMPVVADLETHRNTVDVVTGRLADLTSGPRRVTQELVLRDTTTSSQLMEHAAAGGTSIGLGIAAKVALACMAVGGSVAACFTTAGLLSNTPPTPTRESATPVVGHKRTYAKRPAPPPATTRVVRQKSKPAKKKSPKKQQPAASSPRSRPAPSPAPAGSTEFGPGSVGSSAAPSTPSAAPPDGGGEFAP